jgi:hypothetical protein
VAATGVSRNVRNALPDLWGEALCHRDVVRARYLGLEL